MTAQRYLLDSNTLSAFVDRRDSVARRVRDVRQSGSRIGTCEPVIAEMYLGLEFSASKALNLERLHRALQQIVSWPFDRRAAMEFARIGAELKRAGQRIQIVDMMIASVAISIGNATVVTSDSDFTRIKGLAVENWF